MPRQPPVYRPPGARQRKAWAPSGALFGVTGKVGKRKRGRAGMRQRAQILAEEPFCRECLKAGRRVASDVVDHIVPLAWGGSDDRANKQALCDPCHDEKSKRERAEARAHRN